MWQNSRILGFCRSHKLSCFPSKPRYIMDIAFCLYIDVLSAPMDFRYLFLFFYVSVFSETFWLISLSFSRDQQKGSLKYIWFFSNRKRTIIFLFQGSGLSEDLTGFSLISPLQKILLYSMELFLERSIFLWFLSMILYITRLSTSWHHLGLKFLFWLWSHNVVPGRFF